ncbi:integrase [Pantoea sp. Ap-967]|uniref:integrase n=1 Tax=Pantoea sp. Ap-967 TaxID=2608362 RepID=UPI00141EE0E7|nr:integrase [Pantoea sp. Ap-967]NIE77308.1 integrase [Pantoea sp. Ap-967]
MRYVDRKIQEIDLRDFELDECQRLISSTKIEELVLRFTDSRSFDIGALCYQSRNDGRRTRIKRVDLSTFRPERSKAMREWVVHNVTLYYTRNSGYTISQNASKLNSFFNWAERNDFSDFLKSPENYHVALQAYTQELNTFKLQKSSATLTRLRSEALHSGPVFFPQSTVNFHDDLPRPSNDTRSQSPTEPPLKHEIEAYLTPLQYLFDGLTDFLLNFKKYPAQIPFMAEYIWLLPGDIPFISAELLAATSSPRLGVKWDYERGRVRTFEEAKQFSSTLPHHVRYQLDEGHAAIKAANDDKRHLKRMQLAKLAHDAFIPLFVANSGINEQPLRDLPFDGSYETFDSNEKGFVGIKMRAGGREIRLSIKKTFVKHLDKFIRLRKFICENTQNEYLFVGMTVYEAKADGRLREAEIKSLNFRIKNFLILDFKGLSYQKLRKYKSNFLLSQGYPIQVVSALMQTSEVTVFKSYANANETTAIAEITAMMKRLVELLDDYSGEEIPAGDCADTEGRSDAVPPPPDYEPNCKNFEGCIYCTQFRTHANEASIRKLLSMRFVIMEYLNCCEDKSQFDRVHGAAIAQIDRIITELLEKRPEMAVVVDRVSAEINNEFKLSDYWKRFYHRMIQLKVMK